LNEHLKITGKIIQPMDDVTKKTYRAEIDHQDWMELVVSKSENRLKGAGCSSVLRVLREFKDQLKGDPSSWEIPKGVDHGSKLMRELVLKARGEWKFPYEEEELCHCRMVKTKTVDQAVLKGAHTVEEVARKTTAGTGCGTCRYNTEEIINYRKTG
jgi:bacterioferritin-associated ferredoxin